MTEFWQYAFVPSNILYSEFYIWFIQRGLSINYEVFFYNIFHTESIKYLLIFLPVLISFFQVFGVWKLIVWKKYRFLLLVLSPIFFHLVASYLKIYPTDTRLMFYLLPNFLVIAAIGLYSLKKKWLLNLVFAISGISVFMNFPIKIEEVKPLLKYADENMGENDYLYVFNDVKNVVTFYTTNNQLNLSLKPDQIIYGKYNIINTVFINQDSTLLDGKKGYLLFANVNNLRSRKSSFDFNLDIMLGNYSMITDENLFIEKIKKDNPILKETSKNAHLYSFNALK